MTTDSTAVQIFTLKDAPHDIIGIHQLFNEIVANRAVIDIRPRAEFDKLHIKNSVHKVVDLNDETRLKFPSIPSSNKICIIGGTIEQQQHIYAQTKKTYRGFKSVASLQPSAQTSPLLFFYNRFKILNLLKNDILQLQQQEQNKNKQPTETETKTNETEISFTLANTFKGFAAQYPFLCTNENKASYTNSSRNDEYPNIIIPAKLFLGSARDRRVLLESNNTSQPNLLNLTHILNISMFDENENDFIKLKDATEMHIEIDNFSECDISKHFPAAIKFIDQAIGTDDSNSNKGNSNSNGSIKSKESNILFVHCQMGISRSASVVMAYLMNRERLTLYQAYKHLVGCRPRICPIIGFRNKLIEYEKKVFNGDSTENLLGSLLRHDL